MTFEYTLLKGINDSVADARTLAAVLKKYRLNSHVNLIPYNFVDDSEYEAPSKAAVKAFEKTLIDGGCAPSTRTGTRTRLCWADGPWFQRGRRSELLCEVASAASAVLSAAGRPVEGVRFFSHLASLQPVVTACAGAARAFASRAGSRPPQRAVSCGTDSSPRRQSPLRSRRQRAACGARERRSSSSSSKGRRVRRGQSRPPPPEWKAALSTNDRDRCCRWCMRGRGRTGV